MSFRSPRILPALTVAVADRGLCAGLLLRAQRRRPGLHPEDLLPARAAGHLRHGRLDRRGGAGDPPPAHGQLEVGRARLRLDPHLGDLRRRGADHRRDLGPRLVGEVVRVGRADAGQLPDRLPPVLHVLPAALRDRGPRAPGPLRVRVRDHGRRLRAAQLHRRAARQHARPPARLRDQRGRAAAQDVAHVPRLPRRDGAAVADPGELRARGEVVARAPRPAAAGAGG